MRVYKVSSLVEIDIDEMQFDIVANDPSISEEEKQEFIEQTKEDMKQESIEDGGDGETTIGDYQFNLVAEDFLDAVSESIDHLEETSPNWYKILDVSEIKDANGNGIEIANLHDTCTCAYCQADTCSPDMLMLVACPSCKEVLRLADTFESIKCIHCGEMIERKEIKVNAKGQYEVVREKVKKNRRTKKGE
jgi:predicted RNA-binding Zn-ribbon protein involved in translation (DUF1610 family)